MSKNCKWLMYASARVVCKLERVNLILSFFNKNNDSSNS